MDSRLGPLVEDVRLSGPERMGRIGVKMGQGEGFPNRAGGRGSEDLAACAGCGGGDGGQPGD